MYFLGLLYLSLFLNFPPGSLTGREYQQVSDRIQQPETGDLTVTIDIEQSSESAGLLIIYAYDLQLSEYITYNVIIKMNSYRSDYSTVDNGFGCFGSLNIFSKMINF